MRRASVENALTPGDEHALRDRGQQAGHRAFEEYEGPSAIAFVSVTVDAAKAMRDFAKDHDALIVKGGLMEGQFLDEAGVKKLADLESREVLLAKLAGAMMGNLYKAAYMFQAPLSQAVRTVDALRAKAEEQGGAAAPAAE